MVDQWPLTALATAILVDGRATSGKAYVVQEKHARLAIRLTLGELVLRGAVALSITPAGARHGARLTPGAPVAPGAAPSLLRLDGAMRRELPVTQLRDGAISVPRLSNNDGLHDDTRLAAFHELEARGLLTRRDEKKRFGLLLRESVHRTEAGHRWAQAATGHLDAVKRDPGQAAQAAGAIVLLVPGAVRTLDGLDHEPPIFAPQASSAFDVIAGAQGVGRHLDKILDTIVEHVFARSPGE